MRGQWYLGMNLCRVRKGSRMSMFEGEEQDQCWVGAEGEGGGSGLRLG